MVVTEKAVAKHINDVFAKLDLPVAADDNRRVLAVLAYLDLGPRWFRTSRALAARFSGPNGQEHDPFRHPNSPFAPLSGRSHAQAACRFSVNRAAPGQGSWPNRAHQPGSLGAD